MSEFEKIKPQSWVVISHEGREIAGRVVMSSPTVGGWVGNFGGPHGTPYVITEENFVRRGRKCY